MIEDHIKKGTIYVEKQTYIGIAEDGVHCFLGIIGEEDKIEKYLADYPTTDKW